MSDKLVVFLVQVITKLYLSKKASQFLNKYKIRICQYINNYINVLVIFDNIIR